jgi:hypothetical protein
MTIDTGPTATTVAGAPAVPELDDRQAPPARASSSDATRYLCAGVHLHRGSAGRRARKLREAIAEHVTENDARALGISPGTDLGTVVVNCREAERRLLLRDVVLAALTLALIVLGSLLHPSWVVVVVVIILAAEVLYAETVLATWGVVARRFLRGSFDPEQERARGARMNDLLAEVSQAQEGNVTVYSGFSPFVGSGFDHGGWSFALNLSHGAERFGARVHPRPFSVSELYEHVAAAIEALRVPGLSLQDRLYVDGRSLRRDGSLLIGDRDRPLAVVDPATVERFVGGGAESVRHYKTIRVVTWGGELVLSIFLRFSIIHHSLFAEASYFLLPPVDEALHEVDELHARPSWGDRGQVALRSAVLAPVHLVTAPWRLIVAATKPVKRHFRRRRVRREVRRNAAFDHGARTSVREAAQSQDYRQYFQKLDRELFIKVIERELFDSIVSFLEDHDIDTAELKQRETTVLNNGVIVAGGTVQAETMAVGDRARALVGRMTAPQGRPAGNAHHGGAA